VKRRIALPPAAAAAVAILVTSAAVAASSPSVTTGAAGGIRDTSARLSGTVNPNGASTSYFFQWGPTTSYGFASTPKTAGSGTKAVSVSHDTTGLLPGTLYHYRLVAQNSFGVTVGRDRTFKTTGHPLPGAVTGPASGITTSSAIVTGAVLTNGANTNYWFQYGLAAGSYTAQTTQAVAHASTTPVTVAAPLTLLAPGTTIHYRLVASRTGFTPIFGADAQFTTLPLARPYPGVDVTTVPHRSSVKPFIFTTTGMIVSSAFPAAAECNGQVEIRYFFGLRLVSDKIVTVGPNCAFASQVGFSHRFRLHGRKPSSERLRIAVRFLGNGYLAPRRARVKHVVIG
jgi:hypothetical protein